jgi:formylglycine-generating enzyme required for sulfatase activity
VHFQTKTINKESHFQLKAILLVMACLLFAGAYSQLPLFYNNQNTHFERGLANAGFGYLSSDWYAQQTEHIPVFSAFVSLVQLLDSHWIFYALHGVLAAVYALSLFAIAHRVFPGILGMLPVSFFFAMLTLLHSPWIANPYVNYTPDWTWVPSRLQTLAFLSTNGMAGQYILGPFLQPSAFGVLLIASLALFVYKKEMPAVVCAVFAATVQTPYILHTALLTGAYMALMLSRKNVKSAAKVGGLALLLIMPIVLYVLFTFYPTNSATTSMAQTILFEERTPHHLKISVWFSHRVYIQLLIMVVGLLLSYRHKRLFFIFVLCTIGSIGLTSIQAISGSHFLALLSPWRVFTWLIPVSMALTVGLFSFMATHIISTIPAERIRRWVSTTVICLFLVFLVGMFFTGVNKTIAGARADGDRETVISYAKKHAKKDETYLIPLMFEKFRLASGVPVFVDWKSHAIKDSEILEWYMRVQLAKAFYGAGNAADAGNALRHIQNHASITHIVAPPEAGHLFNLPYLRLVFQDKEYNVFHLEKHMPKDFSVILKSSCETQPSVATVEKPDPLHQGNAMLPRPTGPPEDSRTFTSPILGAKFALIPSGTYTMGSPPGEPGRDDDEGPQRQVTISQPFYMQTTEVTQEQWKRVVKNNPSYFKNCGDDCPVEQVSWSEVQDFIRRLNSMEGTNQYRLPTEAQWEYAARAGTTTPFNAGNCLATDQANYDGNNPLSGCARGEYRQKTIRVGSFAPNAWGLYDMHGNVWEWVLDWYGVYPSGRVTDPEGPSSGFYHVARGGSWGYCAMHCRSASRLSPFISFDHRTYRVGFRLIRAR